ncbi:MAG: hypothetical protein Greene041619_834 [Candidatus Peregrinibacteria bacterium Greene0416_19]|nr:MAG: hypothetical protein Greene041619_834 [Candidatus Peregrinibacteria bacterium Greene0416_19]
MPPLTFEQEQVNAALMHTVVSSVLQNSYRNPKKVARLFNQAKYQPTQADGPIDYYRSLTRFSCRDIDYGPLASLLTNCKQAFDLQETAPASIGLSSEQREAINALLDEATARDSMRFFYEANPELDAWVGGIAGRIYQLFRDTPGTHHSQPMHRASAFLGALLSLHNLLSPAADPYRIVNDNETTQYTLLASCISKARCGIAVQLYRLFGQDAGEERQALEQVTQTFAGHQFRLEGLPAYDETFRRNLVRQCRDAEVVSDIIDATAKSLLLPLFADANSDLLAGGQEEETLGASERCLPWGQVILVRGCAPGVPVYYVADGVTRQTRIGIPVPAESGVSFTEQIEVEVRKKDEELGALQNVWMCRIDDMGKVFFSKSESAAPAPSDPDYQKGAQVLRLLDHEFNALLLQEWERNADLFSSLLRISPCFIVRLKGIDAVLCRSDVAGEVSAILSKGPCQHTEACALASSISLEGGAWTMFPLTPLPTEEEATEEPGVVSDDQVVDAYFEQRHLYAIGLAIRALRAAKIRIVPPEHGGSHAMAIGPRGRRNVPPKGIKKHAIYGSELRDCVKSVGDMNAFVRWVHAQKQMRTRLKSIGYIEHP